MAIPVFNPGDWLPREHDNGSDPGAMTGFGIYGNTPDEAGVVDTQGAFNPVFNGRTAHPMFEANTDWLTRAMPGLARRAQAGDANAAAMYGAFYRDMQDKRGVYSRVFANGLNDRNATAIMNHVFDYATDQVFGAGQGQQFRQRYADYLGNQAKYRGANADDIFASEARMDETIRSSYLSTLGRSATSRENMDVMRRAEGNKGILGTVSLELKTALQKWEQETGLRSDEMRSRILSRAAQYFAMAETNPGLNPMLTDTAAMIRGAASDVGATVGDRAPNLFNSYETAMKSLSDYVTFGGSGATDLATFASGKNGGVHEPKILSVIRNELATGFAQNIYAGRDAWDFDSDTKAALRSRLIGRIRDEVAPRLRASDQNGSVTSVFVNRLIGENDNDGIRNRVINVQDALTGVWQPYDKAALDYREPQLLRGLDTLSSFASGAVTRIFNNREAIGGTVYSPSLTGGVTYEVPVSASANAYRSREGVGTMVDEELKAVMSNADLSAMAKDNPGLMKAVRDVTVDYLLNANTVADRRWENEEKGKEYAEGLTARIGALFAAQELRNRLVAQYKDDPSAKEFIDRLEAWRPGTSGEDFKVRGGRDADRQARYSGLNQILQDYVRFVEAGESHGDTESMASLNEVNNYLFAKKALEGLGSILNPTDNGSQTAKDNATKYFDTFAGHGFAKAFALANAETSAIESKRLMAKGQLATGLDRLGITEDQKNAWYELTDDITSSSSNPKMAEIASAYLKSSFSALDLTPQQNLLLEQMYLPATVKVVQQVMRYYPQYGGVQFAPNGVIHKAMDGFTIPSRMYAIAEAMSEANRAQKLADYEARGITGANVRLKEHAANEEGRTAVR